MQLFESLREQFAPIAAARGLELRVRGLDVWVYSDRALLRRILQNFLANALRYTPRGGALLSARRRHERILLQVWDTGPGIAPQYANDVFKEFHRLEQRSPWGEKGLGLGLSICERIARMLGSGLSLRSMPGHGSGFGISVPLAAQAAQREPRTTPAPMRDVAGLRALCVDNDPTILEGMQALLSRWGILTDCAIDLPQALAAVSLSRPDVLLVDFHLQHTLDGLAVLDALRRALGEVAVPGALLTADGSDEVAQRARQAGYPVLLKPIRPAAFRALLASLTRHRRRGTRTD
jgi:CheY-like chemotaxis protein